MSLCSRDDFQKSGLFAPEKLDIGLFQGVEFAIIPPKNRCFTWPDPRHSRHRKFLLQVKIIVTIEAHH